MIVAVATCLGQELPKAVDQTKKLLTVAKPIVTGIVEKKFTKENLKDKLKFLEWFKKVNTTDPAAPQTTTQSATQLPKLTTEDINKFSATGSKCGQSLKKYVDKVQDKVRKIMKSQPTADLEYMQFAVLNSEVVLKDLPTAAAACLPDDALDGVKTEAEIVTALQVIVDQIISAAFGPKNVLATAWSYKLQVAQYGLDALALLDPTGIASLTRTFLQPICGPTKYDDANEVY